MIRVKLRSLFFRITRLDVVEVIQEQDEGRKLLDERLDKIAQVTLNGDTPWFTDNVKETSNGDA